MDFKTGIGKTGVALAYIIAFAMCVLNLIFHPVIIDGLPYGLCLPSPDMWPLDPVGSWIINLVLVAVITLLLFLINKSYNFIRTTEPALIAIFPIMTMSVPWFSQGVNTSVILCLVNVVCLAIIFASYDTRNATQQMFTVGVFLGIGSMFQYAFLPMAFVYFVWALFMKVLRIKETFAFVLGILCPYWIALGIGWLKFSDFQFPSLTPLFDVKQDHYEIILLLVAIAIAAVIGFMLAVTNFMKLYAGNSKVNAMNLCINILGAASVICILVDFDNMPAYVVTLFMCCAIQLANICALWNPPYPWLVSALPSFLYIAVFVCSLIF
ncbi:MAG: hypothetical protein J1F12_04620 [Muribaculaceae bacterium]|nr:hypothetical protein [Muribaculaceae bacterium]